MQNKIPAAYAAAALLVKLYTRTALPRLLGLVAPLILALKFLGSTLRVIETVGSGLLNLAAMIPGLGGISREKWTELVILLLFFGLTWAVLHPGKTPFQLTQLPQGWRLGWADLPSVAALLLALYIMFMQTNQSAIRLVAWAEREAGAASASEAPPRWEACSASGSEEVLAAAQMPITAHPILTIDSNGPSTCKHLSWKLLASDWARVQQSDEIKVHLMGAGKVRFVGCTPLPDPVRRKIVSLLHDGEVLLVRDEDGLYVCTHIIPRPSRARMTDSRRRSLPAAVATRKPGRIALNPASGAWLGSAQPVALVPEHVETTWTAAKKQTDDPYLGRILVQTLACNNGEDGAVKLGDNTGYQVTNTPDVSRSGWFAQQQIPLPHGGCRLILRPKP